MFLTLRVVAFVRSCSSAVVEAGLAGSRCLMVSFLFPWLSDIVFAPCSAMLHGRHKAKRGPVSFKRSNVQTVNP